MYVPIHIRRCRRMSDKENLNWPISGNKPTFLGPALAAPFLLIFLSNLFIAFDVKLLTNLGKLSSVKGIATFVSAFFLKLANQGQKHPPLWIVLDIWPLLSLISDDILLAKAFFILVVCLVAINNSCGNSSYWTFFLFIFNIAVLFFAADFNLFN